MDTITLMFGQISVEVDVGVQMEKEIDHESEQNKKENVSSAFKLNPLAKEFYPEETIFKLNPFADEFYPDELYNSLESNPNQFLANNFEVANAAPFFPKNYQRVRNMHELRGTRNVSFRFENSDKVKRTIYVSHIDPTVTEDQVVEFFRQNCGEVTQSRLCTKQNSHLQFAFVEFRERESAENALIFDGTLFGSTNFKVVSSSTSIVPLDPTLLPKSKEEMNLCARTIFCSNIDKEISQIALKEFFEESFGKVTRMRLLADASHPSQTAFIEFARAESATMALTCHGIFLGSLPIRVIASKTQVQMKSYCAI